MKRILLAAGMIVSLGVYAQDNQLLEKYLREKPFFRKIPGIRLRSMNELRNTVAALPAGPVYSHTLSTGQKVFTLPQDQMPCIMPSLETFNMPNVGDKLVIDKMAPGIIPNSMTVIPGKPRTNTTLLKKP